MGPHFQIIFHKSTQNVYFFFTTSLVLQLLFCSLEGAQAERPARARLSTKDEFHFRYFQGSGAYPRGLSLQIGTPLGGCLVGQTYSLIF